MVYYLGCYPQDPSLWRGKCTELHSEHVCLFSNLSAPVLCSTRGFVPSSSMYFESWEGMLNGHYILLWKCLCSGCLWEVRASQKVKVVPFLARSNGNRAGVADLLKHCGRMIVLNLLPQGQHVSTYKKPAFANRSPLGRHLESKRSKPVEPKCYLRVVQGCLQFCSEELPGRGSLVFALRQFIFLLGCLHIHSSLMSPGSAVHWPSHPLEAVVSRGVEHISEFLWHCRNTRTANIPPASDCWWAELQPLLQL